MEPTRCWCQERPRFQSEGKERFGTRYSLMEGGKNKVGLVHTSLAQTYEYKCLTQFLSQVPEISGWPNDILAFSYVIFDRIMEYAKL